MRLRARMNEVTAEAARTVGEAKEISAKRTAQRQAAAERLGTARTRARLEAFIDVAWAVTVSHGG